MARNLVRFDPFAEISKLQRRLISDDLFGWSRSTALPTTDVYTEDDRQLTVETHLPKFEDNEVSVSVDQGALIIQAEKREKEEDKDKKYVVRESSTSLYRRIALPDQADEEHINARFENGILKVTVPFQESPAPKTITIESGKSSG